jgi:bifunctional UDP-N-acetylglucosamine pyrophosphorylase/glucosamine-1-phosphate N-acetyltransferase
MKSERPKVLHEICGRPALWYVVKAARAARPTTLAVVVHRARDQVAEAVRAWGLDPAPTFVEQRELLGTANAVAVAEYAVGRSDDVLVMAGDDPLVTGEHVRELLSVHRRTKAAATILTASLEDPTGYARVVREGHRLVDLVGEDVAEADPEVRSIREVSTLVYAFRRDDLYRALPLVGRDDRSGEHYLFHVLGILKEKGERLSAAWVDLGGGMGVNSRSSMARVSRIMRDRIIGAHMSNGVTFVDPATAYVDVDVRIGPDTTILPATTLEGSTRIGRACTIGPATRIKDSVVGDEADVTFSVVREARIGPKVTIGPYASLRPGTVILEGGKAGTFVEIKASRVGKGSKVPHLSYVGDATIGDDVNVGAGTVTVNYDGFAKHPTVIGDQAHIGSDTMLVAPVKVGKKAWTGAGSVITKDVPAGALAVERGEQRNVPGYDQRKRAAQARRPTAKSPKARGKAPRGGRDRG